MKRYEERRWKLRTVDNTDKDEPKGLCISYLCPVTPDYETFPKDWINDFKQGKPSEAVSGKEKTPFPINYDKVVDTAWLVCRIEDKLFTKKKTGGVRKTLRKDAEKLKPYEEYNLSALLHYAQQAQSEGTPKVILSWQEIKLLGG